MRSYRTWWLIFGICAAAVMAAMAWTTARMVELQRAERTARDQADRYELLHLALWRADSWFAPLLAREAARPYYEYHAFYGPPRVYTKLLHEIDNAEVLTPSPLLTFEPEFVRLHFQVEPDGTISSPQVPTGNLRDLAEGSYVAHETIEERSSLLDAVGPMVGAKREMMTMCIAWTEDALTTMLDEGALAPAPAAEAPAQRGAPRAQQEWTKRQQTYAQNNLEAQQAQTLAYGVGAPSGVTTVSPLVPVWSDLPDGTSALLFVRNVTVDGVTSLQGFLCDWPALRDALLAQTADLLPDARLVPVATAPTEGMKPSDTLATVPARLEVAPPTTGLASAALDPTTRNTLTLAWLAVVVGLIAVAVTLRASIAFGEKRSRFASAVTHEMRTPLTTFRMYSEMLAEGMVRSPEQRQAYLETLKSESDRLARLVENVLSYARLERGARRAEVQQTTVGGLFERLAPPLGRLAEQGGMTLRTSIDGSPDDPLSVDVEAVAQILSNLVDNACKYANGTTDRTIDLAARVEGSALALDVRDHGPGVPGRQSRAIFAPFDRGGRDAGDPKPGVGLGLALARGLARSLGGDLCLVPSDNGASGACFRVTVPRG